MNTPCVRCAPGSMKRVGVDSDDEDATAPRPDVPDWLVPPGKRPKLAKKADAIAECVLVDDTDTNSDDIDDRKQYILLIVHCRSRRFLTNPARAVVLYIKVPRVQRQSRCRPLHQDSRGRVRRV